MIGIATIKSNLHIIFGVLAALSLVANIALGLYAHVEHGKYASATADCNTKRAQDALAAGDAARQAQAAADADTIRQLKTLATEQAQSIELAHRAADAAKAALAIAQQKTREVYAHDPDARHWRDQRIPAALLDSLRSSAGHQPAGRHDDHQARIPAGPGGRPGALQRR